MDRERLDNWCERGILGLMLAALVFGVLATGAVRPQDFLIPQGLVVAALALWGLRVWLSPKPRVLWTPVCWVLAAFLGYALWRYRHADIEYVARQELIHLLVGGAVFFLIVNNLHRQETMQWLAAALVFLGMAVSFYALYQFLTDSPKVWHFVKPAVYAKRASGTYICPNHLAGFLEMTLPLALGFVLAGRQKPVAKVLWGYAAIVMLVGIGVTVSRGGWVSAVVALVFFFAVLVRNRHYRLVSFVLVGLLALTAYFFVTRTEIAQKRLRQATERTGFERGKWDTHRAQIWLPAWKIWREDPWLGAGPGHFDYRYPQHRPEEVQARPLRVHNDYLNVLVDWGAVGAGLAAVALGLMAWGAVRTWKFVERGQNDLRAKPSNRSALVLGAVTGLVALAVHSLIDFNLYIPANALVAFTLAALLTAHLRFTSESYWLTLKIPGRLLSTGICLVAVAWLGQQGVLRAREFRGEELARSLRADTPATVAALKATFAIEPGNAETAYWIGELLRLQSWQGEDNYAEQARDAITWFERAAQLNPLDPFSRLRHGMCLDWLGRRDEAGPLFQAALALDPNGYYTVAHQGWHAMQVGDYAAARTWFERSLQLTRSPPRPNPIATSYLAILKQHPAGQPGGAPPKPAPTPPPAPR